MQRFHIQIYFSRNYLVRSIDYNRQLEIKDEDCHINLFFLAEKGSPFQPFLFVLCRKKSTCISSNSFQQITASCKTLASQEQCKLSDLLKWLTLPIIASTIAITCAPFNWNNDLHQQQADSRLSLPISMNLIFLGLKQAVSVIPASPISCFCRLYRLGFD